MTAPHQTVFAVDPALNRPGVAVFVDGRLFAAEAVSCHKFQELPIGIRIDEVARACADWWVFRRFDVAAKYGCGVGESWIAEPLVVYEKPVVRGGPRTVDGTDAIHIGMVASAIWAHVRGGNERHVSLMTPTPEEWTRGSKKSKTGDPWASQRGKMVARRLSPEERALVPACHDAIDAVGLGLHALGRLDAVRVISRGRGRGAAADE